MVKIYYEQPILKKYGTMREFTLVGGSEGPVKNDPNNPGDPGDLPSNNTATDIPAALDKGLNMRSDDV